jgi:alkylation response protein AidB-like acyl-CoA dehydrogenase
VDFAFSADQQLLRNAARSYLDEHCKPATVRALWDDPRGVSDLMWKEMAQLGWLGLALPEAHGGSDLGMVETAILLEELGRAAAPAPYLPTVLAAQAIARAGTGAQKDRWLPGIASGGVRATVALLDADLDWDPAATGTRAEPHGGGHVLTGIKQFASWAHVAQVLLIPAQAPEGLTLFLVDPAARGLAMTPVSAMEPSAHWVTLALDHVPVGSDGALGTPGDAGPVLRDILRRGAIGAAAEMLGAARRCLEMSVSYAKVREQFGQPIGSFQAIRHTCAEMLLAVENSHAATYYAAWALDAGAEDRDMAASVAKAYVGEAARKVCGDAIQVHGGIGFTWEFDLHLYFKRAQALEPMYGDGDYHRDRLARHVAGLREGEEHGC